jgi:phosphatidylserine/phosphatidylglycerophosphate/cardiolipin synthase-like enzyme
MKIISRLMTGLVCGSALFLLLAAGPPLARAVSHPAKVTLLPNRDYGPSLLKSIRKADKSIVFTFFVFKANDKRGNIPRLIVEELVQARKRGVSVLVLLDQERTSKNDSLNDENRETADFLRRGGVRVVFESPKTRTHVKAAVFDNRYVYVGSHNLTQSALKHNNELSVLIDSPDLADEVLGYLDNL